MVLSGNGRSASGSLGSITTRLVLLIFRYAFVLMLSPSSQIITSLNQVNEGRFQVSVYHRKGLLTFEGLVLSFVTRIRCLMEVIISDHLSFKQLCIWNHMHFGHQGRSTHIVVPYLYD